MKPCKRGTTVNSNISCLNICQYLWDKICYLLHFSCYFPFQLPFRMVSSSSKKGTLILLNLWHLQDGQVEFFCSSCAFIMSLEDMIRRAWLCRKKNTTFWRSVYVIMYMPQSIVSLWHVYMKTDLYTMVWVCNSLSSFRVALIREVYWGKNLSLLTLHLIEHMPDF